MLKFSEYFNSWKGRPCDPPGEATLIGEVCRVLWAHRSIEAFEESANLLVENVFLTTAPICGEKE